MQLDFVIASKGINKVRGRDGLADAVFPAAALDQIIKQQRDDVIRLKEGAILVHNTKAIGVAVGGYADVGFDVTHLIAHRLQQVVVWLRSVASEEHIAVVVNGCDLDPGVSQE